MNGAFAFSLNDPRYSKLIEAIFDTCKANHTSPVDVPLYAAGAATIMLHSVGFSPEEIGRICAGIATAIVQNGFPRMSEIKLETVEISKEEI
ncbi:hypothetical protein [Rhodobacter lacus]|uniref:Uncharacterized protein n=1 Tax=Rhodobacter lacus TaxID=1641972 RepID=A0ABW5ABJ4_9RHOB